jgi:hypothetical protein
VIDVLKLAILYLLLCMHTLHCTIHIHTQQMLARVGTAQYPSLPARTGVSIIKNISGPIELTYGSVLFHLPGILLARCTSSRQMLMHSIVQQSGSGLGSTLGGTRVKER